MNQLQLPSNMKELYVEASQYLDFKILHTTESSVATEAGMLQSLLREC